jgi:penicillin-binding protein 1A
VKRSARGRRSAVSARTLLRSALGLLLVSLVAVTGLILWWTRDLPDYRELASLRLRATSQVLARDNRQAGLILPVDDEARVNRRPVTLREVSPAAVAAIVSSEDRHFYTHHGVDLPGLARSLAATVLRGSRQGASTLTAQYVRSTILEDDETLRRKVRELVLSVQVDRYLTKDEILAGYLNSVFWGGNLSGIGAASRAYFGKPPSDLTLAEGVYLAALLPAPNSRFRNLEFVRGKVMKSRLERLVEDGRVSRADADAAWRQPLTPRGWRTRYDGQGNLLGSQLLDASVSRTAGYNLAPHFTQEVRRVLRERLPAGALEAGGLKIYTGLDIDAQQALERAAERADLPDGAQLAAAAVDPGNGEVRALLGSLRDENGDYSEFNRAVLSRRSPGSSLKPVLYTALVEDGRNQWDTFEDSPVEVNDRSQPGGVWRPKNFDSSHLGRPVSMRYALDQSLNLPAVRAGETLGLDRFADKLRLLGLDVRGSLTPSSVLGGGVDASPLQMAGAYAAFANGGEWVQPLFIRRVVDAGGQVLYEAGEPERRRAWTPEAAYVGLDMLLGVVNDPQPYNGGYARTARISGRPVGGKTGTSSDQRDLWFAGVTPGLAAAVWVGRDDNSAMPARSYSGVVVPPIWRAFVSGANLSDRAFAVPDEVAFQDVEGIRMAYHQRPAAVVEPPPEQPGGSAEGFVNGDQPEELVSVDLDVCSDPPFLATEGTDPACRETREVSPDELAKLQAGSPPQDEGADDLPANEPQPEDQAADDLPTENFEETTPEGAPTGEFAPPVEDPAPTDEQTPLAPEEPPVGSDPADQGDGTFQELSPEPSPDPSVPVEQLPPGQ